MGNDNNGSDDNNNKKKKKNVLPLNDFNCDALSNDVSLAMHSLREKKRKEKSRLYTIVNAPTRIRNGDLHDSQREIDFSCIELLQLIFRVALVEEQTIAFHHAHFANE